MVKIPKRRPNHTGVCLSGSKMITDIHLCSAFVDQEFDLI